MAKLYPCRLKSILIILFFCTSAAFAQKVVPNINNNRKGLPVNVKLDPVKKLPYYDFNFLADKTDSGFRTDDEIRAYIEAYPEMLNESAVAETVKAKYPAVFAEAYKHLQQQLETKDKLKRASLENGTNR
jgi:hypothetical protein